MTAVWTWRRDDWLSGVLDRPAYVLKDDGMVGQFRPPPEEQAFCFAKLDVVQVVKVAALLREGFYVVDTQVTLDRPARPPLQAVADVTVSEVRAGERGRILAIAEQAFSYSRFHLDPLLPAQLADKVKRGWIANYLNGCRGERLWVGRCDGMPAGFLAELAAEYDNARVGVIDLIAVDEAYRGRGVARQMIATMIAAAGGYDRLRVGTQAANVPSLRLYEGCGFRVAAMDYVLHAHFMNGTPQICA